MGIYEGGSIQPNLRGLLSLGGGLYCAECHFSVFFFLSKNLQNTKSGFLSYVLKNKKNSEGSKKCV